MNQKINQFIFALKYSLELFSFDNLTNKSKVIALIAQDYLGGKIFSFSITGNIFYFNEIEDIKYDFLNLYKFPNIELNYNGRDVLLNEFDTNLLYQKLQLNFAVFFEKLNEIETSIKQCEVCQLSKVIGKNIYFGTNTKLLLVGEAPANNGWRITGKAWINEKGSLIPSGKVLEKLLENTNIGLFDISFVELIKCFPSNRKELKEYANNCLHFFNKQLELVQPDIIITLGEIPTKILLKNLDFKNLSDVVGKEYKYNNSIIIPIYHPSPISPKSYTGNKPIFDNIISKYIN